MELVYDATEFRPDRSNNPSTPSSFSGGRGGGEIAPSDLCRKKKEEEEEEKNVKKKNRKTPRASPPRLKL